MLVVMKDAELQEWMKMSKRLDRYIEARKPKKRSRNPLRGVGRDLWTFIVLINALKQGFPS